MSQADIECIAEPARAAALLHPLRRRILEESREETSASRIAERIDQPRQKVNYHLRELVRLGFLRPAGERTNRNLVEKRYLSSARNYVISPEVLEALAANWSSADDRASAAHLLALTSGVQSDVARLAREAAEKDLRVPTWSLETELAFADPGQRARFARELENAVADVVRRHSRPVGHPRSRPYRLVATCHPIPAAPIDA